MQINFSSKEIFAKIVYYGPGAGGKTTNLQYIFESLLPDSRSRLISMPNAEDRTIFFDLLALIYGEVRGHKIRFQLYTVPGQAYYNATRRVVLQGVDGIVFVADSNPARLDANIEAMQNLYDNLSTVGMNPQDLKDPLKLPMVIQYNKRDLSGAMDLTVLQRMLNPEDHPAFQAVATQGKGVFETLSEIMQMVVRSLRAKL